VSGIKKIALLTDGIYPFIIGGMKMYSFFPAIGFMQVITNVKKNVRYPFLSEKYKSQNEDL
jgi:hypothetical protein